MPPLQLQNGQLPADWNQRVQVVQQPIQNPQYIPTIYGQQVLMPGNILQQGFQPSQIQVISAGKPLQGGQITQQMLANAQGAKQVIGNSAGGFSGAYTLPTSQSQAILISSPFNVFNSQPQQQQQNILPMTTANAQNNGTIASKNQQNEIKNFNAGQKVVQKANTGNASGQQQQIASPANAQQNQQCVQVSQSTIPTAQIINQIQQPGGQQMQFTAPVCLLEFVHINCMSFTLI